MHTPDTHTESGKRRRYSDAEQAEALATLEANGGNTFATAAAIGIPETTLRYWKTGERRPTISAELCERKKSELADWFTGLAGTFLGVAEGKAEELDAKSATIAAAVCVDKALLLRGEATTITSTADDERSALLRERYTRRPVHQVTDATTVPPALPDAADAGNAVKQGESEGEGAKDVQ